MVEVILQRWVRGVWVSEDLGARPPSRPSAGSGTRSNRQRTHSSVVQCVIQRPARCSQRTPAIIVAATHPVERPALSRHQPSFVPVRDQWHQRLPYVAPHSPPSHFGSDFDMPVPAAVSPSRLRSPPRCLPPFDF